MNLRINLIIIYNNMKTFIKISEDTIVNLNNVIKIIKTNIKVNDKIVYCIRYYTIDTIHVNQYFDSQEERDIFFKHICDDLIY